MEATPIDMSRHSLKGREWQETRSKVLQRDGEQCVECGARWRLEIHHTDPPRTGGAPYALANLRTLCRRCHFKAEQAATLSPGRLAWLRYIASLSQPSSNADSRNPVSNT